MTNTNSSNILRSTFSLFAIGAALLLTRPVDAQTVYSLVNQYTGAVLSNGGSTLEGAPLTTSLWIPEHVGIQQQWIFAEGAGGLRISSVSSSKYMDVYLHLAVAYLPVVQDDAISVGSSTPWRFQAWTLIFSTVSPFSQIPVYAVKNMATGMCLHDLGNPATGGLVVLAACDGTPRQQWAIHNEITNKWLGK
jgi:hypothetical protein